MFKNVSHKCFCVVPAIESYKRKPWEIFFVQKTETTWKQIKSAVIQNFIQGRIFFGGGDEAMGVIALLDLKIYFVNKNLKGGSGVKYLIFHKKYTFAPP